MFSSQDARRSMMVPCLERAMVVEVPSTTHIGYGAGSTSSPHLQGSGPDGTALPHLRGSGDGGTSSLHSPGSGIDPRQADLPQTANEFQTPGAATASLPHTVGSTEHHGFSWRLRGAHHNGDARWVHEAASLGRRLLRNNVLWGITIGFVLSLSTLGPKYLDPGKVMSFAGFTIVFWLSFFLLSFTNLLTELIRTRT
jgi:hypothetical protein